MLAREVVYHLSHSTSPFSYWVLKIGSGELFAWDVLKLRSSWSPTP
jgi:hypothetical protein